MSARNGREAGYMSRGFEQRRIPLLDGNGIKQRSGRLGGVPSWCANEGPGLACGETADWWVEE